MQSRNRGDKLCYFNNCDFLIKLLGLVMGSFLLSCMEQKEAQQVLPIQNQLHLTENAININTASAAELEKLPGIGKQSAKDIIEHREKHGRFRKPEYLLLVRRVSDKQFREIRSLIKVE